MCHFKRLDFESSVEDKFIRLIQDHLAQIPQPMVQ